jgi:hypothetical protein
MYVMSADVLKALNGAEVPMVPRRMYCLILNVNYISLTLTTIPMSVPLPGYVTHVDFGKLFSIIVYSLQTKYGNDKLIPPMFHLATRNIVKSKKVAVGNNIFGFRIVKWPVNCLCRKELPDQHNFIWRAGI